MLAVQMCTSRCETALVVREKTNPEGASRATGNALGGYSCGTSIW